MKTWVLTIFVLLFMNGCGGGGGKFGINDNEIGEKGTIVKDYSFENAPLINLIELQKSNFFFDNQKNIRSSKKHNLTLNSISLRLTNRVKDDIIHIAHIQNKDVRGTNLDDDLYTNAVTEKGSISGKLITDMKIDKKTGKFNGSITASNYKNNESNLCGKNIDYREGTMRLSGTYTISDGELGEIKNLNIYFESDFTMNSLIFKKESSINAIYNYQTSYVEDMTIVINGKVAKVDKKDEMIGYKDVKIRDYETVDYEYSYPIEGKIYIFTDEVYGYYYIDNSYDHSLTPIVEDSCDLYIYSGISKYIGKNSSMTCEIVSTNRYRVMIDSDDDGIIDTVFTGAIED